MQYFTMCVRTADPAWVTDTAAATIGPEGGHVQVGDTCVAFDPGVLEEESQVTVYHERPSELQKPEDVQVKIDEHVVERGDRVCLSVVQSTTDESNQDEGKPACATVKIPVDPPERNPTPEVFVSVSEGSQEACRFERIGQDSDTRVVRDSQSGAKHLVFNVIGKAVQTMYEVVWVPSKAFADRLWRKIVRTLNADREPLHVRLHYRCDHLGYPCKLLTVIAAGEPPSPEKEEDLEDGLFTARIVKGRRRLDKAHVSSRNHVVVNVEPLDPNSMRMKVKEYTFRKQADSRCHRYYEGMSVVRQTQQGGDKEEQWEIKLEAQKDATNISKGNIIVVVKRQVGLEDKSLMLHTQRKHLHLEVLFHCFIQIYWSSRVFSRKVILLAALVIRYRTNAKHWQSLQTAGRSEFQRVTDDGLQSDKEHWSCFLFKSTIADIP